MDSVGLMSKSSIHAPRPCFNCPFKKNIAGGFALPRQRVFGICQNALNEGGGEAFTCHNRRRRTHCAGSLIFSAKNGVQTLWIQLGVRLGVYDPESLRPFYREIFHSKAQMMKVRSE